MLPPSGAERRTRWSSLRGSLGLLLERVDLLDGTGVDHIGDRTVHAVLAVAPGCLAPSRRPDATLLSEQRQEYLRLLLAEPRQVPQPPQHLRSVGLPRGPQLLHRPAVLRH